MFRARLCASIIVELAAKPLMVHLPQHTRKFMHSNALSWVPDGSGHLQIWDSKPRDKSQERSRHTKSKEQDANNQTNRCKSGNEETPFGPPWESMSSFWALFGINGAPSAINTAIRKLIN